MLKDSMRNLIFLVFLISFSALSATEDKIVLSNKSIGDMPIKVGIEISLYKITQYFPFYEVTHQIASGDSPDYHLYVVSSYKGEKLISFISYINEPDGYEKAVVKLDEVVVYGQNIQDEFGVKPKMHIKQIIALRKNLEFGAGHMDNYIGRDKMWYLFSVENSHGTGVTKEMAIDANPQIDAISWPYPRWR